MSMVMSMAMSMVMRMFMSMFTRIQLVIHGWVGVTFQLFVSHWAHA